MKVEFGKSSVADARSTAAANKRYRCYFTDGGDRIQSYEQIECASDAEAAMKAQELVAATQFSSAEIWQGKRLVGAWANINAVHQRRKTKAYGNT